MPPSSHVRREPGEEIVLSVAVGGGEQDGETGIYTTGKVQA